MSEQDGGAAGRQRITGRQRESLLDAALASVRRLLASANALCRAASSSDAPDPAGLLAVAAGLYTYALEEYGKLLLVERLPEKGGVVSVPRREIFGSHQKKFNAAVEDLPTECSALKRGIFDPGIFDPGIFDTGMQASFPSRTRLLYLGMDRNGDPVAPPPPDAEMFTRALCCLERAVVAEKGRGRTTGAGGAARDSQTGAAADERQGHALSEPPICRDLGRPDQPPSSSLPPRRATPRRGCRRSDRS